jgi:hypothetical protein
MTTHSALKPHRPGQRGSDTNLGLHRLRLIVFTAMLGIFLALLYVGPEVFLPSQGNDANTVQALSFAVDEMQSFDGYAAMAFIYRFTNEYARYGIIITFGCCFAYILSRHIQGLMSAGIALYLFIPPIFLFLCYFVKDSIYVIFVCAAYLALQKIRNNISATLVVFTIYCLYAFIFRQYFFLVSIVFIFLMLFKQSIWLFRILAVLSIPVILMIIPDEIYTQIQGQRDIVNFGRIGFSGSGNRTAFLNYVPPEGVYSFLVNYGYAIIRLNFPIFFHAGIKEMFMMSAIFAMACLLIAALSNNDRRVWRPALLFTAHFLVLMLFEPDLGSYLRHICTSLPLLAPALEIELNARVRGMGSANKVFRRNNARRGRLGPINPQRG